MKTIIDEEIAPSTNASDWGLSRAAAFVGLSTGTKSDDLNQSYDDKQVFLRKQTGIGTRNKRRIVRLRPDRKRSNEDGIIGDSEKVEVMRHQVGMVAKTDSTVLILGETGTGKELVAKAIQKHSLRSNRPFIKVNCAAIPSGLLESELYGHERGAFTGALRQRIGRFELANGGTLFLDEIGDIPLELQPKLLRVLQEQEFERVGGTQTIRVDVRIIAATSRDLDQMAACGEFRSDLYYRLNVFPLEVPALRDRPNDILELVCHFVELAARRLNKIIDTIPADLIEAFMRHYWPGNVRELQHFVERSVILSSSNVLAAPIGELEKWVEKMANANRQVNLNATTLREIERKHIVETLTKSNWIVGGLRGAATKLGLPRTTLISRMQKLGIISDKMTQPTCVH